MSGINPRLRSLRGKDGYIDDGFIDDPRPPISIDRGDFDNFEKIRWSADYLNGEIEIDLGDLAKYELTEDQSYFLFWEIARSWGQLTPEMPQTVHDVARVLDLAPSTLYHWRRRKNFIRGLIDYSRMEMQSRVPDVLRALTEGAAAGSIQHIKEYVRLVGLVSEGEDDLESLLEQHDLEPDIVLRSVRKALQAGDDK